MRFAMMSSGTTNCKAAEKGELCVNVRLTHQDIANLISASRQTVSTTLANLRRIGALRIIAKYYIHISNPGHLRELLETDDC